MLNSDKSYRVSEVGNDSVCISFKHIIKWYGSKGVNPYIKAADSVKNFKKQLKTLLFRMEFI